MHPRYGCTGAVDGTQCRGRQRRDNKHVKSEDRQQRIAERKTARIRESFVRRGGIDLFLWKGSKDPTLVQRFGAWTVGAFFGFAGVAFWFEFLEDDPIALRVIPIVLVLLGAKIFRNGFSRKAGIR